VILRDDYIDLGHIWLLVGEEVGHAPAASADLETLFEARIQGAVTEKMAVEVELGRHDDCVEIQPPYPLSFGEFVKGINDGGEFGPDLRRELH